MSALLCSVAHLLCSVAGVIAAKDNSIGVVGVAAGAILTPVRVTDSNGYGTTSAIIAGVEYVGTNGTAGDVANISLIYWFSQTLNDAVNTASAKPIYFTIAAGNFNEPAANYSPMSATGTNVYTISAIDSSGNLTSWSNYGLSVDYAAPGVNVATTNNDGGYFPWGGGTSMSAPHAAGVLLVTNGHPNTCGYVKGDKDSNPDPMICVHE